MAFRFTDQHAMSLVAPLLFPGEQVLFRARGVEKPWYSTVLWAELDQVALGWGIFNKTLRFESSAKRFAPNIIVQRFWMKGNFDAAQGAAGAWEQHRNSLPRASLPPMQQLTAAY